MRPRTGAAHYNIAMDLAPQGKVDARNNLGVMLMERGRLDEAAEQFAEALRVVPGYAQARANLERTLAAARGVRRLPK